MSEKIVVPTLGESVTEATVAKWLKNKGDKVSSDEPLVELETDKVNVEVPSPSNGVLENISAKEGETVNVGALLGSISLTKSSTKNPEEPNEKKSYYEIVYATIIKVNDEIKEKKDLERIILCDVPTKIYPDLENSFLNLIHNSGHSSIKIEKKIDFQKLYNERFN